MMTRDEAEMAAINAVGWEFSEDARRHLAILFALGLLKLDEGKRSDERSLDFGRAILGAISDAGFRIAPK